MIFLQSQLFMLEIIDFGDRGQLCLSPLNPLLRCFTVFLYVGLPHFLVQICLCPAAPHAPHRRRRRPPPPPPPFRLSSLLKWMAAFLS